MLKYVISQWSKEDISKVFVENVDLFYQVASKGHLPILKCLVEALPPEAVETMVEHKNYLAFRLAASHCDVQMMAYLIALLQPEQVINMLLEDCHRIFKRAYLMGHLPVLKCLIQYLPEDVLAEDLLKAFRYAVCVKDDSIINYLLCIPNVFDYAEQNSIYEHYTQRFITEMLKNLNRRHTDFKATNSLGVFDCKDRREAILIISIINGLTLRDKNALQGDLQFLLMMPSVKALMPMDTLPHQSVLLKTWGVFAAPVNAAITQVGAAWCYGADAAGECSIS